jgi:hypothetical protein
MATPTTNFGFSSLNTEIFQRTSTTAISLNDAGAMLGYGATSQVSLSDLRRAFGGVVTSDTLATKFYTFTGWDNGSLGFGVIGAITNRVVTSGGSTLSLVGTFDTTTNYLIMDNSVTPFKANQVTRFAAANTLRTISNQTEYDFDFSGSAFSGNVTFCMKFTV